MSEQVAGNEYATAVEGYPDSWFRAQAIFRAFRRAPRWLRGGVASCIVVAIGVQVYAGTEMLHSMLAAARPNSPVRWDCINSEGLLMHGLLLIVYYAIPPIVWCFQAVYSIIFPAVGVAMSAYVTSSFLAEDSKAARADFERWYKMLKPVFYFIIGFVAVGLLTVGVAHLTNTTCPPPPTTQKTHSANTHHIPHPVRVKHA